MDSAGSSSGVGNGRKRQLSLTAEDKPERIRRRIDYDALADRLPSPPVFTPVGDDIDVFERSFSSASAPPRLPVSLPSSPYPPSLSGLIRRASSQSLASQYNDIDAASTTSHTSQYKFPDISAKYHLRNTKIAIDYSPPPQETTTAMCVSGNNILYFTRGNRIHTKNLSQDDSIIQFYKPPTSLGSISLLACSSGQMAVSTTNGSILLLDSATKKRVSEWSTTKGVGAMRFNGNALLTIGTKEKGQIRCYDTRINPKSSASSGIANTESSTLKDKSSGVTRHQSPLTALEWSPSSSLSPSSSENGGRLLASGDSGGTIFLWDFRKGLKTPLDIGEYIQRNRKKIQHEGSVSSLAFCPWQPKILASADMKGVVRLWSVDPSVSESNAVVPGTIQSQGNAPVVGVAFSGACKEFVVTYGACDTPSTSSNSIAVYTYPGVRHVNLLPNSTSGNVTSSVLTPNGQRLILSVPSEGKLRVCDVWGKEKKELKRVSSFMGGIR